MTDHAELHRLGLSMIEIGQRLLSIASSEAAPSTPEAIYMKPADYAARRMVCVETVRRWVKMGLPHRRAGRSVRIIVKDADAWEPTAATSRLAEVEAAKGT